MLNIKNNLNYWCWGGITLKNEIIVTDILKKRYFMSDVVE